MGSVRARPETGKLVLDFTYGGERCREQTALDDTRSNRKRCEQLLKRIDEEITLGTFDYARYIPQQPAGQAFRAAPLGASDSSFRGLRPRLAGRAERGLARLPRDLRTLHVGETPHSPFWKQKACRDHRRGRQPISAASSSASGPGGAGHSLLSASTTF